MLLVPFLTGAFVGGSAWESIVPVLLLAVVALGLFCVRTPIEAWLKISPCRPQNPGERRVVLYSIYIYSALSLGALGILLWQIRFFGLYLLGAAAATTFLGQSILKNRGRQYRLAAQLVGSIGLTSSAAAAYYVASGRLDTTALVIWGANWLFAANQILYVQTRIHSARTSTLQERISRGKWFILGEIAIIAVIALAWRSGWLPGLAMLAFAPLLLRGLPWFFGRNQTLQINRLGIRELAHAVLFGALLIVSFRLHG